MRRRRRRAGAPARRGCVCGNKKISEPATTAHAERCGRVRSGGPPRASSPPRPLPLRMRILGGGPTGHVARRGRGCPVATRSGRPHRSWCRVQRGGRGSAARPLSAGLDSPRVRRRGGVATATAAAAARPAGPQATKHTTARDGGRSSADGPPHVAPPRRRMHQSRRARRRRQARSHFRFRRCRQQWLVSSGRGDGWVGVGGGGVVGLWWWPLAGAPTSLTDGPGTGAAAPPVGRFTPPRGQPLAGLVSDDAPPVKPQALLYPAPCASRRTAKAVSRISAGRFRPLRLCAGAAVTRGGGGSNANSTHLRRPTRWGRRRARLRPSRGAPRLARATRTGARPPHNS